MYVRPRPIMLNKMWKLFRFGFSFFSVAFSLCPYNYCCLLLWPTRPDPVVETPQEDNGIAACSINDAAAGQFRDVHVVHHGQEPPTQKFNCVKKGGRRLDPWRRGMPSWMLMLRVVWSKGVPFLWTFSRPLRCLTVLVQLCEHLSVWLFLRPRA